jgi:purine nucleosidase
VTLCTLGPLTDIAMALVKAPEIAAHVRELVMMGGAYFEVGNVTPAAEFNIYVDPEAADVLVRSGIPIVMAPLDLTHRMLATKARLDAFRTLGNRTGAAVAGLLGFSERFDLAKYGSIGAPLHDPTVIAHLLKPELFSGKIINVSVEIDSPLTLGMTVADWWQITDRPRNVNFLRDGNAEGFFDLLTKRLARLP